MNYLKIIIFVIDSYSFYACSIMWCAADAEMEIGAVHADMIFRKDFAYDYVRWCNIKCIFSDKTHTHTHINLFSLFSYLLICLLYTDDITVSTGNDDESSHHVAVDDYHMLPIDSFSVSLSEHASSQQPCQPVAEATQSGRPWQPSREVTRSEHLLNFSLSRQKSDAGNTQFCCSVCSHCLLYGNMLRQNIIRTFVYFVVWYTL